MPTHGFGAGRFGAGRFGFDSPTFTVPAALPQLPRALSFDAAIRAWDVNSDGTFVDIHPVDQLVQQLLTIEQGSVPALGKVGQRYRKRIQGLPPSQIPTVCADETKVALKKLIDAGDVALLSVVTDASVPGRVVVRVNYQNLRDPNFGKPGSTPPFARTTILTS